MADRVRIIGGSWRGRWLDVAEMPGLRPTGDRVRETLFNWLQNDIGASCCLDLFAGSGALGFEAASRGASEVHLVEHAAHVSDALKTQSSQLTKPSGNANTPSRYANTASVSVHCADSLAILGQPPGAGPVKLPAADIIFVDPPFSLKLQQQVLLLLSQNDWLKSQALVYIEMERAEIKSMLPEKWAIHREQSAGGVTFGLVYFSG